MVSQWYVRVVCDYMKITIKVITKSKNQEIQEQPDNSLKVKLKSAPVKGKANEELIELLAKHYQVAKSQIQVIRGFSARNKLIEIDDM